MRIINLLAAAAAISMAGGAAIAKDKPAQPKGKKVCQIVEPAVGRIPARRVCTVKADATASKAKTDDVQGGAASGGRD